MTSRRRLLAIGVAVSCVFSLVPQAQAHSPIEGIGTFYGYMLHTLVVPAHALLLVGTTLMLGQQKLAGARAGLAALAVAFVAGLAITGARPSGGVSEWLLLGGALAAGGAVSLGRRLPVIVLVPAAAAAGLAVGVDSAPTEAAGGERTLAFAGLIGGGLGLALVVTGLTLSLTGQWQRIGVRIAGSWIVAVSILVLSLSLSGGTRVENAPPQPASGRTG